MTQGIEKKITYEKCERQENVAKAKFCSSETWTSRENNRLEVSAFGDGAEDADSDCRYEECAEDGLEEDGVLNLAKSRLLDPHLAVEDLADNVAPLVFRHPWLVFP